LRAKKDLLTAVKSQDHSHCADSASPVSEMFGSFRTFWKLCYTASTYNRNHASECLRREDVDNFRRI